MQNKKLKLIEKKKGSALVYSLIVLTIMTVAGIGILTSTGIVQKSSVNTRDSVFAFQAANAGVEIMMKAINSNLGVDKKLSDLGTCDQTGGNRAFFTYNIGESTATIFLYDESGNYLPNCNRDVSQIDKIKSTGEYGQAFRAIEVRVGRNDGIKYAFVADENNHRIVKIRLNMNGNDFDADVTTDGWMSFDGPDPITMNCATGFSVDLSTNYGYASDCNNGRVVRFGSGLGGSMFGVDGTWTWADYGTNIEKPVSIKIDSLESKVYVALHDSGELVRFDLGSSDVYGGNFQVFTSGATAKYVAIDEVRRKLYFSDSSSNPLKVVDLSVLDISTPGAVQAVPNINDGDGPNGGYVGIGNDPRGITFDYINDYMYISDSQHNKIRRFKMGNMSGENFGDDYAEFDDTSRIPNPFGIFYDEDDKRLYFTDRDKDYIGHFTPRVASGNGFMDDFVSYGSYGEGEGEDGISGRFENPFDIVLYRD